MSEVLYSYNRNKRKATPILDGKAMAIYETGFKEFLIEFPDSDLNSFYHETYIRKDGPCIFWPDGRKVHLDRWQEAL